MKRFWLLIAVVVLFSAGLAVYQSRPTITEPVQQVQAVETTPEPPKPQTPDLEELFTLTNAERAKVGVAPLQKDERLYKSAQAKCDDMIKRQYFNHNTPDGQSFMVLMNTYLDHDGKYIAENLNRGSVTAKEAIDGWMASTHGHKENILNASTDYVGFGVCPFEQLFGLQNKSLVVQHFLDK